MFGKAYPLFTLFGFEVRLDLSWLILGALIAWTLAVGVFPLWYEGLSLWTYWVMGLAGAIGLLLSIVFHELSHSLMARRYGLPIRGITLFVFGGVAEMNQEPHSPKAEFFMAVVGPIASFVLAGLLYALYQAGWPVAIGGVLLWLAAINGVLGVFNLVPAFPLDGGRILRAALWAWKSDFRAATRTAAGIGSGFGILLVVLGFFLFIQGAFIAGVWWFLIGLFLRTAARMTYRDLLMRQVLEGEPVRRFMHGSPVTVAPATSLREFVDDYLYKYQFDLFPVVENGRLLGTAGSREVKGVPREQWERKTVGEVAQPTSPELTVRPETDAVEALSLMSRKNMSRLMVVEEGRVVGILTLKDLLRFFSLKADLNEARA